MPNIYDQTRQPAFYASTGVLLCLATTAVFFRLLARRKSAANFWWEYVLFGVLFLSFDPDPESLDTCWESLLSENVSGLRITPPIGNTDCEMESSDYTIAIALVLYYFLTICYWLQASLGGSGLHTVNAGGPVDAATQVKFQKIFLAIQIFYFSTSVSFKSSLILLYYRLFGMIRWFRTLLVVAECIVACYFIVCLFTAIFECKPVAYYWDKNIPHGSCINETDFYRWNGVANLLIDFMILSLTFPMVWRLKISTRQKATLSGVFLLGTFVFIASIIRVTTFGKLKPTDETFTGIAPAVWSEVEQSLGIVCACLLCLRPLLGRFFMGSNAHGTIANGTTDANSRDIELVKRGNESTAGFARLAEEQGDLSGTVNEIRAARRGGEGAVRGKEGILKRESFELRYNAVEDV
ncbi:MAG: hypothetical protein ASARMPRED_007366 [Alectoria sarmentosa]|nr:MAG: hypothetical protein ASARMPRED_007366 [Alectoria sarmentosa]